jgi:hypothetical protein
MITTEKGKGQRAKGRVEEKVGERQLVLKPLPSALCPLPYSDSAYV